MERPNRIDEKVDLICIATVATELGPVWPSGRTCDDHVVLADASADVEVCVVLLVEHLLRGRQLDGQRAHPSHRVVVAAQRAC
jgi:hypothetical protein